LNALVGNVTLERAGRSFEPILSELGKFILSAPCRIAVRQSFAVMQQF
jgi:hypothetical protein